MTKGEARTRAAAWRKALSEGRVLRIGETIFRSFLTHEDAVTAELNARADGFSAHIVEDQS